MMMYVLTIAAIMVKVVPIRWEDPANAKSINVMVQI